MSELKQEFKHGQAVYAIDPDLPGKVVRAVYQGFDEKHNHHLVVLEGENDVARRLQNGAVARCATSLTIRPRIS